MRNILAAIVSLSLSPAMAAQIEVTPQAMQIAVADAYQAGQLAQAANLADALLQRDPKDLTALIVRTQAAFDMGDFAGAAQFAARSYRAAQRQSTRYQAARYAARAHAEMQQFTRAQFWLRLARENAGSEQSARQVAEDYGVVRRLNPLSFQLSFGISPTSNINGGSSSETTSFFLNGVELVGVISPDGRPLSGTEISGGITARYRLSMTNTSATFADMSASFKTYRPSQSAKEEVPDIDGSDFSEANLSFGLTHRRILLEGLAPASLSARVSRSWYATDPYTQGLNISASQAFVVSEGGALVATATYQLTDYLTDSTFADGSERGPDATKAVTLSWRQDVGAYDKLQLTASARRNTSDTENREYDAKSLRVSYDLGRPVASVAFDFSLGYEWRDYEFSIYNGGNPRHDEIATVRISAELTNVEYYGFRPVINLDASRAMSDVDLFDRESLAFGFDLVSSF